MLSSRPLTWVVLALVALGLDFASGPYVYLGPLFLVPLALAAWHGRLDLAIVFAVVLPATRLMLYALGVWQPPGGFGPAFVNAAVRLVVLALVAVLIRRARHAVELEREVATLRGLLPICLYCKRVEDSDGKWLSVEQYVGARSEAGFTHRVCPNCTGTHRRVFLGSNEPEDVGGPSR